MRSDYENRICYEIKLPLYELCQYIHYCLALILYHMLSDFSVRLVTGIKALLDSQARLMKLRYGLMKCTYARGCFS